MSGIVRGCLEALGWTEMVGPRPKFPGREPPFGGHTVRRTAPTSPSMVRQQDRRGIKSESKHLLFGLKWIGKTTFSPPT